MSACPGPAFAIAPVASVMGKVWSCAGSLSAWSACRVSRPGYTMLPRSARRTAGADRRVPGSSRPLRLHGLRLQLVFYLFVVPPLPTAALKQKSTPKKWQSSGFWM
jgi:hypothetical protein